MRRMLVGLSFGAALAAAIASVGPALATPASGFTGTTIAVGRFGDIDVTNQALRMLGGPPPRKDLWLSLQRAKGPSDLYVQSNLWVPGGTTGWHTHPGHSLIIVTAGTVTAYNGDDHAGRDMSVLVDYGRVSVIGRRVHVMSSERPAGNQHAATSTSEPTVSNEVTS